MGTETTVTSTPAAETAPTPSAISLAQGLTEISENDLMGFSSDVSENDTAPLTPKASEELAVPEVKKEEAKAPVVPVVPETLKTEEPIAPPKGFVPLQAVQEVRTENKYLKQQLATLESRVNEMSAQTTTKAPEVPAEFADFQELTKAEFTALANEEPAQALLYMETLNAFRDYKRAEADKARDTEASQSYLASIYEATNTAMEEAVPGIFDESTGAMSELRDFAVSVGFTDDMFYLTNPATQIIIPGESTPLVLGEQAASIIKMLAGFRTKVNSKSTDAPVDAATLEATLRAKIEPELRATIEQEVMAKIKTGEPFKSLNALTTTDTDRPEFSGKILNETQLAKLSPKEQELYLAGA